MGIIMKSFLLITLFISTIFANDIVYTEKDFQDKDYKTIYLDNEKLQEVLKVKIDFFEKLNLEINGSITIQHTF